MTTKYYNFLYSFGACPNNPLSLNVKSQSCGVATWLVAAQSMFFGQRNMEKVKRWPLGDGQAQHSDVGSQ
jgi:hypothetical protein